ncbi:MAG: PAS domain S-box protein [Oscillochloris sp.]|nr:PAS domain S-box protein [Oscillochloris sp.]
MDRVIGTIALAHPDRIQLNERLVPLTYSLANFIAALVARKRAEEQSAASERQMREILDKIAAGVLLMDTEGRYRFANQRGASMFGLTPAEVIGKSIADLLSPETSQSYLERTRRFIATQSFEEYEDTFTLRSGTRTFFIADQVLTNEQGEGYALLTSSIDITERKQNENALRQSEHAFRTLYESMRDAFVSVDMSGKIRQYNSSFKELVGYTDEELTWLTYEDITPNQWHAIEERIVQEQILPHGYSEVYEKEYRTKNGKIIPIELRTVLTYDEDGQPSGMWAIIRDITMRKRDEAALHQTMEELRRSNADLEQFAYVASHDLQEPLRAVTGMVQLLQQRYQGQIDARADQYIGLAVEAATRMQALINDLLAFSRLERCGKPFVPTAAASALDGARMNLQVAIQESGAIITHDELPVVLADPTQLMQIFQNLLSNAIKFRSEESPHIHITAERRANAWCFSVHDNGIGIAPDYFTRIFVIFQRLHSRHAYPGTGIGLALCKKIVERHGGQIWVESRLGHGATFSFTIPDSERTYGSVITSQTD